jgi:DNA-binding MarR family transcriptional regulator
MNASTALDAPPVVEMDAGPDTSGDDVAQALAQLWQSMARMRQLMNDRAQSEGLSLSAFIVLRPLVCSGPLRASDLAEIVYLDLSWISRQVAHLVERGLVERRADRTDGRVCILAATEAGIEAVARLQQASNHYVVGKVADWSEQDRTTLAALLGRLTVALEAAPPSTKG